MADRIIKGDSGNDVVIQNNAGSRKIEVTNSGDVEITGDVKTTTVKATNLKANDGTASLEVADSTGDIGFSGNTDLKIKLPSAGGLYESDGSTEILTESSGAVSLKNTILNSNNTFPTGHIIQTLTDTHIATGPITIGTTADDTLGSNLQVTITPKANGNKLFIQALIHGINNEASAGRSLHSGFAYDANFSSSNGTTIGPRAVIADYHNYVNANQGILGNLQYSTIVTVGTNAPSAGSASIIRPILQSTTGSITIAANSGGGLGVFSMIVMEVQA